MALKLKISVEENCDSLYLFDCTGKYDKKCNPTGWGRPNEILSNAESAVVKVYPPEAENPIVLDLYPDFPTENGEGYEILPEDIGSDKFKSGVWKFEYEVRVSGVLYFVTFYKLLTKDLECCLNDKKVNVDVDNFDSKEVINSNNISALFKSAVLNACRGKIKEAEKIIKFLYIKCSCSC